MTPNDVKIVADNIDDFIEVPDGVTRLRKAVLTLAVSGKLVPQDKKEGTAEELYKEIQEYQKKKIEGRKKKILDSAPLDEEEAPFEIPKTWKWVRFTEIASIFNGNSINKNEKEIKYKDVEGIPYIATKDVGFDHVINYESGIGIPKDEWNNFKLAPKNSVFVCAEGGSAGRKVAHLEREVFFGNKLFAIHPPSILDSKYVFYYCTSSEFFSAFQSVMAGLIGGVSINKFGDLLLPLPPAGEQVRIVKKVEEVMKQLDELENKKQERDEVRIRLACSAMLSLGKGESKIAFEQLIELIKTPDDIKKLENALLTLAVSGKLTRQNLSEGTAQDLFTEIQLKRGEKKKALPPVTAEEMPFELPKSWMFVRLGDVVSILGDGLHGTPNYSNNGDYYFINGNNLVSGRIELKSSTKRVSVDEYQKHGKTLTDNTVLVSINGTLGNFAFYEHEKVILGKSACYFNLLDGVNKLYVGVLIRSPLFLKYAVDVASQTTIKNISLKSMRLLPLPLPPFLEQKRIVKKVEEVMVLINRLKQVIGEK